MAYLKLPKLSSRLWSVWRRNKDVFMKTYKVNFAAPFVEPLLYLIAFGFGIGTFVSAIGGVSYARFIAPALLAISVMNSAFFECTFGSFVRMYYQKMFDAMIATPLSIEEVITGELIWGATKSAINATIMLGVLFAFGLVAMPYSLLVIPVAFMAGLLFASIAMCFTAVAPSIDSLNYPSFLFVTPMFLFSGTFFPLALLPQLVQYFAVIALPLTHVVTIMRSLTLASFDVSVLWGLAWIAVVLPVVFVLAINLMKNRLIK